MKIKKQSKLVHTGDCGDNLSNLQPVQNGGFSCAVQTQDQNPHFPGAEQAREDTRENSTWRIDTQGNKSVLRKVAFD